MNHLDRGHRWRIGATRGRTGASSPASMPAGAAHAPDCPRPLHLFVVGGLAALMLAVPLPGVASAGTTAKTAPYAGFSGVSAAQDQYGGHQVLKPPPVIGAKAARVATAPAATPAPAATSATTILPFTGFALLKVVLIGLGLVALGFALRRWPARGNDQ